MSTTRLVHWLCALSVGVAMAGCGDDDDDTSDGDADADSDGDVDGDADGDGDGDTDGDVDGDADCGADAASDDPEFAVLIETAKALREEYDVPGMAIAVLEDGAVAHEALLGVTRRGECEPITADTHFRGTAAFANLVAAAGVHAAGFDLAASVHDTWLPELAVADGDASAITMGQLLNVTAGIPWWDDGTGAMTPTLDELLEDLAEMRLRSEPGRIGSWSGWSFALAGAALAADQESTYEQAIRALVFDPLEMSAVFSLEDAQAQDPPYAMAHDWGGVVGATEGVPNNEGAYAVEQIYLTLHDAEALFAWLLEDGTLLEAARANAVFTPWQSQQYSHALFIFTDGPGVETIHTGGLFRGYMVVAELIPSEGFGFVALMNVGERAWPIGDRLAEAAMTMAGHSLATFDNSLPVDRWDEYVGTYVDALGAEGESTIAVTLDQEELTFTIDPGDGSARGPFVLTPAGRTDHAGPGSLERDLFSFEDRGVTYVLVFYRDAEGTPAIIDIIGAWGLSQGNPYLRPAD